MSRKKKLGIPFYYACSLDFTFTFDEDMKCEVATYVAQSEDGTRDVPLFIKKRGNWYSIGEIGKYTYDAFEDTNVFDNMRHPSLIRQQYGLPADMPSGTIFLGPMTHVNMIRFVRLVQATLSNDPEVKEDTLGNLRSYYEEKGKYPHRTLQFRMVG